MLPNTEVLNSWKEVAGYLGRGVRTVQRWEQELGLPVRRPRGKSRSAVIAFKPELDQWLRHAPVEQLARAAGEPQMLSPLLLQGNASRHHALFQKSTVLFDQTRQLLSRSNDICELLKEIQCKMHETLRLTTSQLERNSELSQIQLERNFDPTRGALRTPLKSTSATETSRKEAAQESSAIAS